MARPIQWLVLPLVGCVVGLVVVEIGHGHWNQGGHRLAARELSSRLCAAYGKPGLQ